MTDSAAIEDAIRVLTAEQERVASIVASLTDAGWQADLQPLALERLLALGHFLDHTWEVEWRPYEVVGHLRDSARIFTERIERIRREDRPQLPDFRTGDPDRIAEYHATDVAALADQLTVAQEELHAAVTAVPTSELDRIGVHETDGPVRLSEVIRFVAAHQRDHREQLSALTAEALG